MWGAMVEGTHLNGEGKRWIDEQLPCIKLLFISILCVNLYIVCQFPWRTCKRDQ